MAPIHNLSVLAFASAALAVPHAQWQPFKRHAHPGAPPAYGSSAAPAYGGSSSAAAAASSSYYSAGAGGSSAGAYGSSGYAASTGYGWGHGTGYARPTGYSVASSASAIASGSYSVCTETSTLIYRSTTEYSTYYVTHTVYGSGSASVVPASSYAPVGSESAPAYSAPAYSAGSGNEGSACVPDVTVTTTVQSTVYVTPGSSSGEAAASSLVIPNKSGGGWGGAPSSKSAPAPSGSAAPSYSGRAPSSYGAAPSSAAPSSYGAAPSSAAPSYSAVPSAPVGGGYSGKRGLAYNDASLCDAFIGTDAAAWAYNWGSSSSGLDSSIPYIPMLWGPAAEFSDSWAANAKAAIAAGAEYLFSFNEPDMSTQANLSPEAAAAAWKQYMEPFAGQAKLVAPSVTNGQGAGIGADWLKQFLGACSGCTIDAVSMHWYYQDNPIDIFKQQISDVASLSGKPIWLNEFGATGSDADKSKFLETVMPWMDSNDSIL